MVKILHPVQVGCHCYGGLEKLSETRFVVSESWCSRALCLSEGNDKAHTAYPLSEGNSKLPPPSVAGVRLGGLLADLPLPLHRITYKHLT